MIQSVLCVEIVAVPNPPQAERLLRDAELRVTAPRKAVLMAVHEHPHADTETLLAATRERLGSVSHQAVYDVLRALTSAGLVRCSQPRGSLARYEARVGDNHHHAVCRSCGANVWRMKLRKNRVRPDGCVRGIAKFLKRDERQGRFS